ncbi:MAG: hypothetical protein FJW96_15225, partial [Actinobacteria bacterium]|nr:hypothetical protein [Actinomycetota bacterium]
MVLRSLESSGEVSFVCLGRDGSPRDVAACPDVDPVDGEARELFALLTQPFRGEVAVVSLTGGRVVDAEPSIPGYGFLPVGADPVSLASTPGSTASFVGVAEVGREGIFALPSSCILGREEDAPLLGIDSWPACRLPSAPGELAVLIDPAVDHDGDAATPPLVRSRCDATDRVPAESLASPAGLRDRCPADLSGGEEPPGRQKLLATLPDRGAVVVIDAQELLDREPGSFDPCPIERYLPLAVDLPAVPVPQSVPDELRVPGCGEPGGASAAPGRYLARPAGVALLDDAATGEHHAYVADLEAPVIHSLSTRDPCAIAEEPPLLPTSFADPDRAVTTRSIAVSPQTHDGRRFVYAVDPRGGGSVMVFDVTPGRSERTPLVRARSRGQPFEPPDRIAFDAPAQDVTFVLRDTAVADPDTGVARSAVLCDPAPSLPPESPGALVRPSGDFGSGPRPGDLRGIFAFVALDSGQLATIDVDDWDAACRRPVAANPAAAEDSRGCAGDPDVGEFVDADRNATVTGEESCQIVQPHRARAASVFLGEPSIGGRAPSLRTRPKVVSSSGRTLPTDGSEEGRRSPRLLGVAPSANEPARLYVGTTLLEAAGE